MIALSQRLVPALAAAVEIPGWLSLMTSIATVVISVALTVAAVSLGIIAWAARKQANRMSALAGRAREALLPVLRHGEDVADNLNYITTALRQDVDQFRGTLQAAQARLEKASQATEARIGEFNALLEVVQEEAEQIFIDTASTLRGVRAGADRLRNPRFAEWEAEDETSAGPGLPPRHEP